MFNINCGDDAQPGPTCGMFDTERPGGDAKGPPDMSLDELLSKLDLSEYKSKFESAGVADVPTLARLTEDQLDGFDMRKLEKRKLLHHRSGVAVPKGDDSIMC